MWITDEVSGTEKNLKPWFWIGRNQSHKSHSKTLYEYWWSRKNYQIDESYLLLGKARYYDQRFIPALDAFNYILYKYPNGSNIYEAKILWRNQYAFR
jgi:hypothetical protein